LVVGGRELALPAGWRFVGAAAASAVAAAAVCTAAAAATVFTAAAAAAAAAVFTAAAAAVDLFLVVSAFVTVEGKECVFGGIWLLDVRVSVAMRQVHVRGRHVRRRRCARGS
jgi:hypothetical protein